MIGFTPNEVPFKTVKTSDPEEDSVSEEVDFDALWDNLLRLDSNAQTSRHPRSS